MFDLIVPAAYRSAYEDEVERYSQDEGVAFRQSPHRADRGPPPTATSSGRGDDRGAGRPRTAVTFNAFVHDISERKRGGGADASAQAEDLAVVARVARDLASVTDAHAARAAICAAAIDVAQSSVAILFEPDPTGGSSSRPRSSAPRADPPALHG